jgi:micrococcal nuclease
MGVRPPRPSRLVGLLTLVAMAVAACAGGHGRAPAGATDGPTRAPTDRAGSAAQPRPAAGTGAASRTVANATVVRVVDGDTIRARLDGAGEERVRLIGIDTPETKDPRRPVQCFGREAAARTAALLPPGTRVRLERDVEPRDRYGRLLAYVWRASDGLFVNLSLARDGYALALTIPPNVAHADEIVAAVRAAREEGRGLWSACGGYGQGRDGDARGTAWLPP